MMKNVINIRFSFQQNVLLSLLNLVFDLFYHKLRESGMKLKNIGDRFKKFYFILNVFWGPLKNQKSPMSYNVLDQSSDLLSTKQFNNFIYKCSILSKFLLSHKKTVFKHFSNVH